MQAVGEVGPNYWRFISTKKDTDSVQLMLTRVELHYNLGSVIHGQHSI